MLIKLGLPKLMKSLFTLSAVSLHANALLARAVSLDLIVSPAIKFCEKQKQIQNYHEIEEKSKY